MKLLLVYYNPNHNSIYTKFVHSVTNDNHHVGYINQFGHQVIQIFYLSEGKLVSCYDFWDYLNKTKVPPEEPQINKVIDRLCDVLYKFKKK